MPAKRKGISRRAYAKLAGISHGMVQKEIEYGRVVFHPDGSIDGEASLRLRRQALERRAGAASGRAQSGNAASLGEGKADTSIAGLRRVIMALEAKLKEMDYRERRSELIERRPALLAVHEAFRRERDAWLAWPSRVAARMAARIGFEDVHLLQVALDEFVREHLHELAEPKIDV